MREFINSIHNQILEPMIKKHEDEDKESDYDSQDSYEEQDQYSHNGQENSNQIELEQDKDFFQKHGMFFCGTCRNLMDPYNTKGQILEFRCKRCGIKSINFKNREDEKSMVLSRSLQSSSKKTDLSNKLIFDCSMPTVSVKCPQCNYDEAVYTVIPEEGERKIVVKLLCARGAKEGVIKCDKRWDLDQEMEIDEESFEGALKMKNYNK